MKTTLGLFVAVGVLVLQCVAATEAPNDLSTIDLELKHIKARVIKEQGWTVDFADSVAVEYRKFWLLHKKYPDAYLVPSLDVDEMWHAHILFTQKYAADCDRIFGSFLHHFPTVDEDETAAAASVPGDATAPEMEGLKFPADEKASDYAAMLALYESEFGVKPNHIWVSTPSDAGASCSKCSGCGSKCGSNSTATATATARSARGKNEKKVGGCSSGCGSKCSGKRASGVTTRPQLKRAAGCGNCHAAGSGKRRTGASAGCGSKCGSSGCGSTKGGPMRGTPPHGAAGCGNCHAGKKTTKSGGCGNCHAGVNKKSAGCGSGCGSKCSGAKQTTKSGGCGNCHAAKSVKKPAGCGNCHAAKAKPTADAAVQTGRAAVESASKRVVHLRV